MSSNSIQFLKALDAKANEQLSRLLSLSEEESQAFSNMTNQTLRLMERLFETCKEADDADRH